MSHAKLHIICGNCGCSDMFSFKHEVVATEVKGELIKQLDTTVLCENCSTNHYLGDYLVNKSPKKDDL